MEKKIGFIDYYISEWHADNYPALIAREAEKRGEQYKVAYVWAELDVSPVSGKTTDEWCSEHGAKRCRTIEELCRKSDYIMILAPSDPDKHLGYARKALKFGKRTYIDKTFAPDYATARRIFDLGQKYDTPFFSTSALRFADEIEPFAGKTRTAFVTGGGGNFPEYCIHQVEMAVRMLGTGADSVRAERFGEGVACSIGYPDGRAARLNFAPGLPFAAWASADGADPAFALAESDYFGSLINHILAFYSTGKLPFDPVETLECMRIREALIKSFLNPRSPRIPLKQL